MSYKGIGGLLCAKDLNRGWIGTMREMTEVIKRMCKKALWEII